jgi:uncharacterized protein YeaO (DUF488 family)
MIQLKRAYDEPTEADGLRILVERLWPRGLRKADARIDLWLKDVAPSTPLRQWYAHDVNRWPEFKRRYTDELRNAPGATRERRSSTLRTTRRTIRPSSCAISCNVASLPRPPHAVEGDDDCAFGAYLAASADCAAARRAMGTRYGEHET